MNRVIARAAVLSLVLLTCSRAFALAGEHEDGVEAGNPDWPKELKELLNRPGRVYGYFINAQDTFFYSGNAEAFNAFIAIYAKLTCSPLTLSLNPDRGVVEYLVEPEAQVTQTYEWKVTVCPRSWHEARMKEREAKSRELEIRFGERQTYAVSVELCLGGRVRLKDVVAPAAIEVRAGGGIGRFIQEHRTRQAEGKADK